MMYGKHFASMYEGSMIGAGTHVFAVWGYVISKMSEDKVVGAQVELNPKLLAFILGDTEKRILDAIDYLCSADSRSRSKGKEGKKLVKLGEYAYQVVNGAKYLAIRNEEHRRGQNREAQERFRAKQARALPGEKAFEKALEDEDEDHADRIADNSH